MIVKRTMFVWICLSARAEDHAMKGFALKGDVSHFAHISQIVGLDRCVKRDSVSRLAPPSVNAQWALIMTADARTAGHCLT